MSPKEKALELCNKFMISNSYQAIVWYNARICATIAINEILELDVVWYDIQLTKDYPKLYKNHQTIEFWEDVKNEIEKL